MEVRNRHSRLLEASGRSIDFREQALGLVSTRSFPAIVGTADMMLKSSGVRLLGYEKIGSGYCTAVVRGGLSDVRIAVEVGAETAQQFGQYVSKSVISRPLANLDMVLPIGSRLIEMVADRGYSRLSNQAVGLLETRGFPAMVGACDAMLKSAEVQLAAYEMVGDGLCTAIIRGRVANVAVAVEAGMHEAERIGELHAIMVIPRPLDDMEHTLPVASCWLDKPEPLEVPLDLQQEETELVELPDLRSLPKSQEEALDLEEEEPETVIAEPVQPDEILRQPLNLQPPEPPSESQPGSQSILRPDRNLDDPNERP
jgi:carbon dioxide concentrating mechanism protein CcmO